MSSNSKPESPAQASRKQPLTRSEEENAKNKQSEMTKAYENVEEVQKKDAPLDVL